MLKDSSDLPPDLWIRPGLAAYAENEQEAWDPGATGPVQCATGASRERSPIYRHLVPISNGIFFYF